MVWIGVVIVYLINVVFKNTSVRTTGSEEKTPLEGNEPLSNPSEKVRDEILRKKLERKGIDQADAKFPIKDEKVDKASHYEVHMAEQIKEIKQKQLEAEHLKFHLQNINASGAKEIIPSIQNNDINKKIRLIFRRKSSLKAALIAGEILGQPSGFRK